MQKVVLKAEKRGVTGKQVGALRRTGKLPAVIYGRHVEPVAIVLDAHSAGLALAKLTSSSLVTIALGGKEYPSLVREKQRDFIKGNLTHVDFLAVDLTEKIRASVRVELTGLSAAVKDFNAVLVHGLESIEVECLPTELPERVTVDISALAQIGNGIYVGDVALPGNIRVLRPLEYHRVADGGHRGLAPPDRRLQPEREGDGVHRWSLRARRANAACSSWA